MCNVDAAAGVIRINGLAAAGKSGKFNIATLQLVTLPNGAPALPPTLDALSITDSAGKPVNSQQKQEGQDEILYLPVILR
ncbi:MAG: hypothetical protein R2932_07900 [Caldilineaceae bacterium]